MSAHHHASGKQALFVLAVALASFLMPLNVLASERAGSVAEDDGEKTYLVQNSKKSRPAIKGRKPSRSRVEATDADDASYSRNSSGLASKTVVRGSLGLFLSSQSAMIFGGGVNFPLAKSVAFDGGVDYVSFGDEYVSVSLMRFTGGAAYVISLSPDTVFRAGGRAGLARVAVTAQIPSFFGEESTTYSESNMSFYGEGRVAVEKALGKMTISGEVQIPIIFGDDTADANSLAIYAGLGFIL